MDELVERIDRILENDLEDEPQWSRIVIAKHILEALGLHEERRGAQFYGDESSRRYVTDWEAV